MKRPGCPCLRLRLVGQGKPSVQLGAVDKAFLLWSNHMLSLLTWGKDASLEGLTVGGQPIPGANPQALGEAQDRYIRRRIDNMH